MNASAALLVAAISARGVAQCQYDVTLIAAPICAGGGAPYQPGTAARDMSETGVVVGGYEECGFTLSSKPFMWSEPTGFVTLEIPPGFDSLQAEGVSPNGRYIVGWGTNPGDGEYQSVLWDNGVPMVIRPPGDSYQIQALAVNDAGIIVGTMRDPTPMSDDLVPFRMVDGVIEALSSSVSHRGSADAVNANDVCVGFTGVLGTNGIGTKWAGDETDLLFGGASATETRAFSINQGMLTCGGARIIDGQPGTDPSRPTLWRNLEPIVLPMLPTCEAGIASDVADSEVATGFCNAPSGVLWINEQPFELKQFIDDPRILTLRNAIATNNNGCVVVWGSAIRDGFQESIGALLTPVGSAPSDLNSDCITDVHDVLLLLEQWGRSDSFADVDGSGSVDVFDLFDVLAGWG